MTDVEFEAAALDQLAEVAKSAGLFGGTEIVPSMTTQPRLPGLELTPVGARRTGERVDTGAIIAALVTAKAREAAWNWTLGDLVLMLEQELPRPVALTEIDAAGLDRSQVSRVRAIAGRVPFERRRVELSWSHHVEVAHLDAANQTRLLEVAVNEGLSCRALRAIVDQEQADLEPSLELELPEAGEVDQTPLEARMALRDYVVATSPDGGWYADRLDGDGASKVLAEAGYKVTTSTVQAHASGVVVVAETWSRRE